MEITKRTWLRGYYRYGVILLLILFAIDIILFFYYEKNDILAERIFIKNKRLSKTLADFRLVQISDLHLRQFGPLEQKAIKLINQASPDMLFVTGDILGKGNESIPICLDFFSRITARLGIWVVLGNEDHLHAGKMIDTNRFVNLLQQHGIQVLQNERRKVTITSDDTTSESKHFWIIGVDDPYLAYDDLYLASIGIPAEEVKLLLVHTPDIIEDAARLNIDLMLAGHTHGGQIRFPLLGAVITQSLYEKKYAVGLYMLKNTTLYVNRGIGTASIPLRLFCRPEITLFQFN
jgi:predicted MPP superfamily phosphohydrolase